MAFGDSLNKKLKKLAVDSDDDESEDSLVIGIDFGTTYSGVAWATKVDFENNQINLITSWPDNGREEGKVPTELWYDDEDEPMWGYEVPVDSDPFRWFKLLLLRTEDLGPELCQSQYLTRSKQMMESSGRTAADIVADYLRLLWGHIMSTIERARGETVVEALAIHVVITVPAIWKSYARQAMKDAAVKAGILDFRIAGDTMLTFVSEPEAAALSTLLEQGSGVRSGNVYVICDAGGGTVDLISYEVKSTKPMVLQEAVEGTGGLCGGVFIDQTFEHMIKGRLGPKWNRLSKTGIREIMKNEWEYGIKPRFKPAKARKEYIVSLPAEAFGTRDPSSLDDTRREPYIKNGRIHFLGPHIENTFEAVFEDIEKLVQGQIKSAIDKGLTVTGVILVGGLGSSPYLFEYLKSAQSKAGIIVLQSGGMKSRTAICRGAVMKGCLEGHDNQSSIGTANAPIAIASTVSRASYGIQFHTPFLSSIHLEKDRFWDKHEGEYKARHQMKWYLKRGETVSKIKPLRASWYRLITRHDFDGTLEIYLYQCEDEEPPTRYTSSVQTLGELKCDLDIQYSELPDFRSMTGVMMKRLAFEIELVPTGASVEFVLYINGRKQGSESAELRFV